MAARALPSMVSIPTDKYSRISSHRNLQATMEGSSLSQQDTEQDSPSQVDTEEVYNLNRLAMGPVYNLNPMVLAEVYSRIRLALVASSLIRQVLEVAPNLSTLVIPNSYSNKRLSPVDSKDKTHRLSNNRSSHHLLCNRRLLQLHDSNPSPLA